MSTENTAADVQYLPLPIKSDFDEKEYRVLKLKNGVTALLCSYPNSEALHEEAENAKANVKETTSAAALLASAVSVTVMTGTFDDPEDFAGVSHFLEHMTLKGSKKYPGESETFITNRGGFYNARTYRDSTSYYLSIQPKYFSTALDMVAQFIGDPLIPKELIKLEVQAVESEFNFSKNHDFWIFSTLLLSLAKENHPIRKFPFGTAKSMWGENDDSKRVDDLYEALHAFWSKYYVGSSVYVAVQSVHSLDELERMVVEYFSAVRPGNDMESKVDQNEGEISRPEENELVMSANEAQNEFSDGSSDIVGGTNLNSSNGIQKQVPFYEETPFDTPEFNKIYHISSDSHKRLMILSWFLPSLHKFYKNAPVEHIYYILNNNQEGGLNKYLKRRFWAVDVSYDKLTITPNSKVTQIGIEIELTDYGLEHIPEIIDAVFSYINLLRRDFPQEWLFKEHQALKLMKFNYRTPSPVNEMVDISQNMHQFAPEHYLCGSKLLLEYDPEVIRTCLNFLTPERVNITMLNNTEPTEFYDKLIPYIETPYAVKDIAVEMVENWKQIEPYPGFTLPPPNEYVTSDFSILQCDTCDPDAPPQKVRCDELGELWFKQDSKFKKPKACIILEFISPTISESVKRYTAMSILTAILDYQFQENFTHANNAGMYINLMDINALRIEGYNEHLPILVKNVMKNFVNIGNKEMLAPEIFHFVKKHVKGMLNSNFSNPENVMFRVLLPTMLTEKMWTELDCIRVIDDISLEDFIQFCQEMRSRMYVRALMQGNMAKEQAVNIMDMIMQEINHNPLLPNTWPQFRFAQVEVGSRVCRISSLNAHSSDSSVHHIFFCGPEETNAAYFMPIHMKMTGAVFDTLRTKEALSYDVGVLDYIKHGVQYLCVSVNHQEEKHSTDYVSARIWEFTQQFYHQLEAMDESELKILCQSAINELQNADVTLMSEVKRNWKVISTRKYLFNRNQLMIATLSKITKEDILEWYRRHVLSLDSTTRHLTLQVQGHIKPHEIPPETSVAENEVVDEPPIDTTDSHASCRTDSLKTLPVTLPEGSVCNPIYDIEEYKKSLFLYPAFWS